jgi:dGTPase
MKSPISGRTLQTPAPYASDPARSRGRVYGTSNSPTRSEFQRDRDRIIHSTAFRRLQHKTQVFLQHEGQHFRTRLTHTLEVSQMARSIARALALDEDLAEAVALAHDLGHPPFGHAGERILHEKMNGWGGFDHNVQALRVVTRLENRYAEHDGLNLSWETLEGILKHNGPLTSEDGTPIGRYVTEGLPWGLDDVESAQPIPLYGYASLEAQAAAIADDAAYNAHDIDDALRAGLIKVEDLVDVPLVGPIVREVLARWPGLERSRQAHEIQRRLITFAIEDVIAASTAAIVDAGPADVEGVRMAGRTLIRFSPEVAEAESRLKGFMFARVYRHESVAVQVRRAQALVGELFDGFMQGGELPGRWAAAFAEAPGLGHRARVVCDFIAGMTDPYAEAQHARMFDGQSPLR